jgi:hypothetical protein
MCFGSNPLAAKKGKTQLRQRFLLRDVLGVSVLLPILMRLCFKSFLSPEVPCDVSSSTPPSTWIAMRNPFKGLWLAMMLLPRCSSARSGFLRSHTGRISGMFPYTVDQSPFRCTRTRCASFLGSAHIPAMTEFIIACWWWSLETFTIIPNRPVVNRYLWPGNFLMETRADYQAACICGVLLQKL